MTRVGVVVGNCPDQRRGSQNVHDDERADSLPRELVPISTQPSHDNSLPGLERPEAPWGSRRSARGRWNLREGTAPILRERERVLSAFQSAPGMRSVRVNPEMTVSWATDALAAHLGYPLGYLREVLCRAELAILAAKAAGKGDVRLTA